MTMQLIIRFDYGLIVPWVRRTESGIRAVAGPDTLNLRIGVPLRGENLRTEAEFTVAEGERVPFVLTWHPSHEPTASTRRKLSRSPKTGGKNGRAAAPIRGHGGMLSCDR